jgi:hypothetical protein
LSDGRPGKPPIHLGLSFFEIAISPLEIGGLLSSRSQVLLIAAPDRFSAADRRWKRVTPGLVVATDTAFSSNRFASTHQAHKLDLSVERKVGIVSAIADDVLAATGKMAVNASLLQQA